MREAYQTSKECFDIESDLSVKKENYIYFAIEAQELESFNEAEYYYNEVLFMIYLKTPKITTLKLFSFNIL